MAKFDLIEPRTLEEACAALAVDENAKAVAGGTALLTVIKQGLLRPAKLVNLNKVGEASAIEFDPQSGLRIGALATINEIETSKAVIQLYPVLAEACHTVANIRIRNMATIGGNLAPAELLSAILLPPPRPALKGLYIKFTTGSSEERPCAGIAAFVHIENRVCRQLRLSVGAVSPRVVRMTSAEEHAKNQPLDDALIQSIASAASDAIQPVDDIRGPADYKRGVVQVLTRRALHALANGAKVKS